MMVLVFFFICLALTALTTALVLIVRRLEALEDSISQESLQAIHNRYIHLQRRVGRVEQKIGLRDNG